MTDIDSCRVAESERLREGLVSASRNLSASAAELCLTLKLAALNEQAGL